MKIARLFLLFVVWLAACSPQAVTESTPGSTQIPTQVPTLTPSPTSAPVSTSTITFTPTATLEPDGIVFDVDNGVPPEEVQDIRVGLERIRLYLRDYMGGDIPLDTRSDVVIKIAANGENRTSALDERGITLWFDVLGPDWARGFIPAPFQSLSDEHIKTVPHEYVHGWHSSLGCLGYHYNLLGWWMTEGSAEYIAYQTVFQRDIVDKEAVTRFMLQSAEGTEASVSLESLESTQSKFWPGHIGYLAIDYLMETTQSDPVVLRTICEQTASGTPFNTAFENVFGISKPDFYKAFQEYIDGLYVPTPQPQINTGVSGKIIWDSSYPNEGFDKYMLNFCPITTGECFGAISIQPDGTFIQSAPSGYYFVALNFKTGGPPIGWYQSTGMVESNNCSGLVSVADGKITTIEFKVNVPIPCP